MYGVREDVAPSPAIPPNDGYPGVPPKWRFASRVSGVVVANGMQVVYTYRALIRGVHTWYTMCASCPPKGHSAL